METARGGNGKRQKERPTQTSFYPGAWLAMLCMQCKRPLPIVLHFLDRNETRMVEIALTERSVKRLEDADWRSQLAEREREHGKMPCSVTCFAHGFST
jgi:hypothetical protein